MISVILGTVQKRNTGMYSPLSHSGTGQDHHLGHHVLRLVGRLSRHHVHPGLLAPSGKLYLWFILFQDDGTAGYAVGQTSCCKFPAKLKDRGIGPGRTVFCSRAIQHGLAVAIAQVGRQAHPAYLYVAGLGQASVFGHLLGHDKGRTIFVCCQREGICAQKFRQHVAVTFGQIDACTPVQDQGIELAPKWPV